MQKIAKNIYFNEHKTKKTNTLRKVFVFDNNKKFDYLQYLIVSEIITKKIRTMTKQEFAKIKALNYDLKYNAQLSLLDNNIFLTLEIEIIDLKYIENKNEILDLIQKIFQEIDVDTKDLQISINDYQNLYLQVADNSDKLASIILTDTIYQDFPNHLNYEEINTYLEKLNNTTENKLEYSYLEDKIELIRNSKNYYLLFEGSKTSIKFMEKFLLNMQNKENLKINPNVYPIISITKEEIVNKRKKAQVSIALSYQINKLALADEYKLKLLNYILGNGAFSKLFKNVREKHNICYSIYSKENIYSGINVYTGVDEKNVQLALDEIDKQISEIQNGNFEEEYQIAKEKYLSDIHQEKQKLYFQNNLLNKNLVRQTDEYSVSQMEDIVKKISLTEIQKLAQKMKKTKIILQN